MKIFVKTISGQTEEVDVEPTDSIQSLKYKVKDIFKLELHNMKLIYAGKQLEDNQKVASYGIQKESTVHVVLILGKTRVYVICDELGISELFELSSKDTLQIVIDTIHQKHNINPELQSYFFRRNEITKETLLLSLNLVNDDRIILFVSNEDKKSIQGSKSQASDFKSKLLSSFSFFHQTYSTFNDSVKKERTSTRLEHLEEKYNLSQKKFDESEKAIDAKKKELNLEIDLGRKKIIEAQLKAAQLKEDSFRRLRNDDYHSLQRQSIISQIDVLLQDILRLENEVKSSNEYSTLQRISEEFEKKEKEFKNLYSSYDMINQQKKEEVLINQISIKLTLKDKEEKIISISKEQHLKIVMDRSIPDGVKKENLYQLSKLMVPSPQKLAESNENISKLNTNEEHPDLALRVLHSSLGSQGVNLVLSNNPEKDYETLSLYCIINGTIFETVNEAKFTEDDVTFEELQDDPKLKESFLLDFTSKIALIKSVPLESVKIIGVEKGSIVVLYTVVDQNGQSVTLTDADYQNIRQQFGNKVTLKLHPLFSHCHLSPQSFDPRGNFDFRNHRVESHRRGGFTYTQPLTWKRYGLSVSKKYDSGNDDWLMMNGNPREWAVAFHGLRSPNESIGPIIQNSLITTGLGQAYQTANDTRTNQPCGRGAYLSPLITVCENGYTSPITVNNQRYKVAFQCRVNPSKIRIPQGQTNYWILNDSQDIRPYGILLKKC